MANSRALAALLGPAFSGTPVIRTAVVGVATGLSALSAIGSAGSGGTQLINSAATTAVDTKAALGRIARSHFTCSLALRTTDAGTTVDPASSTSSSRRRRPKVVGWAGLSKYQPPVEATPAG